MDCSKESGTCEVCQSACRFKPGWLVPGDAERIADHLGLSLVELFETKLAVDWWEEWKGRDDVFLLAPALVGEDAGAEYPGNPKGTCTFYADGLCTIHEVKPFECREYVCDDSYGKTMGRHRSIVEAWVENQEQIETLLGRKPYAAHYEPLRWW